MLVAQTQRTATGDDVEVVTLCDDMVRLPDCAAGGVM
jgi:hypothetical protein